MIVLGLVAGLIVFGQVAPEDPRDPNSSTAKAQAHAAAGVILDTCRPLLPTKGAYARCLEDYASDYVHSTGKFWR